MCENKNHKRKAMNIAALALCFSFLSIDKAHSQSIFGILKTNKVDTVVNNKHISYATFYNKINKRKGILLGRTPVECEIVIDSTSFAITPGNIDTKKVYIFTDINSDGIFFNLISNGSKDGMWPYYSRTNTLDSLEYFKNNEHVMTLNFRSNGTLKYVRRYTSGKLDEFGTWLYDRKGRIKNHSSDF